MVGHHGVMGSRPGADIRLLPLAYRAGRRCRPAGNEFSTVRTLPAVRLTGRNTRTWEGPLRRNGPTAAAPCSIYVNTRLLQSVLRDPEGADRLALEDRVD